MNSITGGYTFSHRVFAEYLCAQSLFEGATENVASIPEMGKRVWDSRWETVVKYIVALSGDTVATMWEAISSMPEEFGKVETKWKSPEHPRAPFVLILSGSLMNTSMKFREAELLRVLARRSLVRLVTMEGSVGEIDTSLFTTFPDAQIRREVAAYFLKQHKISGPEYCAIALDVVVDLFGADDKEMYLRQLNLLMEEKRKTGSLPRHQSSVPGAAELTRKRCRAMAENTLARMRHIGVNSAVLHVGQTLDYVICRTLEEKNVSHMVVEAKRDEPDDWEQYARVLTGEKEPLEDVLGGESGSGESRKESGADQG